MDAYHLDNIFARILRGELPCHKVYEDDDVFAFMDIMPRIDGHTLVIPKAAARNLLDVAPEALGPLMVGVQRIAIAARTAMAADGITLHQFSEAAAGQVVFHLHFHVMPRKAGDVLRAPASAMAPADVLADHAARIRAALG